MKALRGHDQAWQTFHAALSSGKVHHGWILAGPRGIGKATFAQRAAAALVDPENRYSSVVERGSHPDILTIKRLPKEAPREDEEADPTAELKRSISVDQIRLLHRVLANRPGLGEKRAVIIDAADDLERGGANALLKALEEPPRGTHFFLVSHASDRLLPTIRSRCRLLRFEPLDATDMAAALSEAAPEADRDDIAALVRSGTGAPGQAIEFLGINMAELDDAMTSIIAHGDLDNALRSALASELSIKPAQARYEAFLRRAPSVIAIHARQQRAENALSGVEAWQQANSLAERAVALSLDKQSVVFQMVSLLASMQPNKAA